MFVHCFVCPYLSFDSYNFLIGLSSFPALYSFHKRMNIHFPGRGGNFPSSLHLLPPSTNPKVKCLIGIHNSSMVNIIISGQTMKMVGIWLRSQVFAHGQLYVACSRVGKPSGLKFAVMKKGKGPIEPTVNVVYKEVLNTSNTTNTTN